MKLLTKEIRSRLPALYSQEDKGEAALVQVKFFNPSGAGTWYATEFDGEDLFFGFANLGDPDNAELGNFSLSELESVRGQFGMKIERDAWWTPRPLGEVMKIVKAGGHV